MTCTSTQKGKHLNTEPFTRTLAAGDLYITLTHPTKLGPKPSTFSASYETARTFFGKLCNI